MKLQMMRFVPQHILFIVLNR